jgi:Right handed beta helix region
VQITRPDEQPAEGTGVRTTATGRQRWILRLLVGATWAALVAVELPTGVAVAAQPASLMSTAVAAASFQTQPRAGPGTSASAPAPTPSAASRARAAEQQQAQARAAEQQARAAALKRAAQLAQAALSAKSAWGARGRPTAMVVLRPDTVDLVTNGRLTRRLPRRAGDLTLTDLDRYLPDTWLSITGDTARLSAAVVLTPRVALDIGGAVRTLKLAGGATLPEAASIHTGSGRLVVHGVTITSSDRTSQQPMPPSPGRPFVVVSSGGRLDASDATFADLGSSPTDPEDRPGVQFNTGSGGSLQRTSLLRNGTGLQLGGSQGMRLEGVTISGSAGDGLVLNGDRGTIMSGIRAERNGGYGVRVSGSGTDRPVTGISTAGNGKFGIAAIETTGTKITGVTTSGDASGGLEVNRSSDLTVTDFTATDEPMGVFTHLTSRNTVFDRLRISGGRRGVMVEKTTHYLTLQASMITGAKVAGVSVGGTAVELRDLSVSDSRTGIRVERGAAGVTAVNLTVSGGQDGVVATAGTAGVVLQNLTADGVENDAVRSFSPNARILGGTITGATTGITLGAATTISGTSITLVNDGIRARSGDLVQADGVDVHAIAVGINAEAGTPFLLTGSRVHALEAVRGQLTQEGVNDLSLPPLNLLGAIGAPFILLALVLELVHVARQHRSCGSTRRRLPPTLPATSASTESPARSTPRTRSPATTPCLAGPLCASAQDAGTPG